ncbi:hypothetical protein [Aureibacter tunicatorum]|uniref:Uncharacterized protein n=1 Tax=Aureibacter tunicatorum TaxID=866807 RepID=A0AAE4BSK8_9BACT|nr:hypothetical protein [Aureibacter tunicatorum]MDR6238527.1 hypothetical protein [Aureibacter tunicatorum]
MDIVLDEKAQSITISKDNQTKIYKFNEVEYSVYNLAIYYKNRADNRNRKKMMLSNFAYWDLKFSDGKRYFITNIMVDFLHKNKLFLPTRYRYRFLPFIDKKESNKEYKSNLKQKDIDQINSFAQKYGQYSDHLVEIKHYDDNKNDLIANSDNHYMKVHKNKKINELERILANKEIYNEECIQAVTELIRIKKMEKSIK